MMWSLLGNYHHGQPLTTPRFLNLNDFQTNKSPGDVSSPSVIQICNYYTIFNQTAPNCGNRWDHCIISGHLKATSHPSIRAIRAITSYCLCQQRKAISLKLQCRLCNQECEQLRSCSMLKFWAIEALFQYSISLKRQNFSLGRHLNKKNI